MDETPRETAAFKPIREGFPLHEQAFYVGAVWAFTRARESDGPLNGGDIYAEFVRHFPPADVAGGTR